MQYILSEEELSNLAPKKEVQMLAAALEWIRQRFVGDECIHRMGKFGYCDQCPLGAVVDGPPHELHRYVCGLPHEYSK